jgi:hypothetical protein
MKIMENVKDTEGNKNNVTFMQLLRNKATPVILGAALLLAPVAYIRDTGAKANQKPAIKAVVSSQSTKVPSNASLPQPDLVKVGVGIKYDINISKSTSKSSVDFDKLNAGNNLVVYTMKMNVELPTNYDIGNFIVYDGFDDSYFGNVYVREQEDNKKHPRLSTFGRVDAMYSGNFKCKTIQSYITCSYSESPASPKTDEYSYRIDIYDTRMRNLDTEIITPYFYMPKNAKDSVSFSNR